MTRPEAGGSDYDTGDYDRDAWQDFTPWRPGDPSTAGEAPAPFDAGAVSPAWSRSFERSTDRTPQTDGGKRAGRDENRPQKRWWTEESAERFATGDRVRARGAVRGDFMLHVQPDTRGKVTGTRLGALSGEWATVEFDNGYTETVRMSALRRDTWL